jgi:PAS domain S-box-containing protein
MLRSAHQGTAMSFSELVVRSVLNSASDALIATDCDGVIRLWNPGAERIFGYSAEEAQGRSLDLIIPEQLRARHWSGYRQAMTTGTSRYGEGEVLRVPGLRKDGSRVSLEFTIAVLKDEGRSLQGLAAILRDVSARYEEVKALKAKLAAAGKPPRISE